MKNQKFYLCTPLTCLVFCRIYLFLKNEFLYFSFLYEISGYEQYFTEEKDSHYWNNHPKCTMFEERWLSKMKWLPNDYARNKNCVLVQTMQNWISFDLFLFFLFFLKNRRFFKQVNQVLIWVRNKIKNFC